MSKDQRPNIRYYINSLPGKTSAEPDNRLWIVSIPAEQMKHFKHSAESKGIWLRQIAKAKIAKLKGTWRRLVVDQRWDQARAASTFSNE